MSNSNNNKKSEGMHWKDFFLGLLLGVSVCLTISLVSGPKLSSNTLTSSDTTNSFTDLSNSTNDKEYVTDIKKFAIDLSDGTKMYFYTPESWYSLSDQYIESLSNYYGIEVLDYSGICVGDAASQYSASYIINASTLKSSSDIMKAIYKDNYDEDSMLYSEAYTYFATGELPEELPDNYLIKELQSYCLNDGHVYRLFYVYFTQEYYTDDTMTDTISIPNEQLIAYSDTDDVIEIICYGTDFDIDYMKNYLAEFVGYSDLILSEQETIKELLSTLDSTVTTDVEENESTDEVADDVDNVQE